MLPPWTSNGDFTRALQGVSARHAAAKEELGSRVFNAERRKLADKHMQTARTEHTLQLWCTKSTRGFSEKTAPSSPLMSRLLVDYAPSPACMWMDKRAARVVDMTCVGGLTQPQIAEALGISNATVLREWKFARAWLSKNLKLWMGGNGER